MAEYTRGFEEIKEPVDDLPTGEVIETHEHDQHHNTDFIKGLWKIEQFAPAYEADGVTQAKDGTGKPIWAALPSQIMQGGSFGSILEIPDCYRHRFTVLEGPARYRCRFIKRGLDGKPAEAWQPYKRVFHAV